MFEAIPSGNAASEVAATKESISEASAAKFKGVKLLEQTIFGPALKTNDSSGGTEEMTDPAGNPTAGQKRKRTSDHDDDPDL
jgi:hypothetical protein